MKAGKSFLRSPARRNLLLWLAAFPFAGLAEAATPELPGSAQARLAALETSAGGRLGVAALDTTNGSRLNYRADERFPLCSTFKLMLVAAVLARATKQSALMARRIRYRARDLIHYSPIAEKHVSDGMRVDELCAAAIEYSDNTAANLLLKIVGSPAALTAFARSIGDTEFRLDRWEPALNSAIPGDLRDTTTPAAMAGTLQRLVIEDTLAASQRDLLLGWLHGTTTGTDRISAGVPANWQVGHKTGTGDYGTANDVAILTPPNRAPLILALYFTQPLKNAKVDGAVLAAATRIVVENFS
ncbi:MAG: class A beta-lactamase [Burkholderiaceae bacterium]|nr:class A beta-lactamase [Burkholderiaceae bacterium]